MNILAKLWAAYRDRPFASFSIQRKLDLRPRELSETLNLLSDMSASGEARDGYQVRCVASLVYKLIKTQRDEDHSVKGLPLTPHTKSHLGQTEKEKHEAGVVDPFPAVPGELKARRQWCVWRSETRGGKPTKVPFQPSGVHAKSNDPTTWIDYPSACAHRARFSGIGFVFSVGDPYCGIDLDNCLDEHGGLRAWALPIVDRLKQIAYGEISPSRRGIKFWTRAGVPPETKHKIYIDVATGAAIEIYDQGRYFTVTGTGKGRIGAGQAAVGWILSEYFPREQTQAKPSRAKPSRALSVDEIIGKISASRQSAKFDALFGGDTTGFGSQSEADCALCSLLAFWTQEADEIDATFRQSGLMRPKWDVKHRGDGATYGQMTISQALALATNRETYQTRRHKRKRRYYGGF